MGIFSSSPEIGVRKGRQTPILLLRIKFLIHPKRSGPVQKLGRTKASGCAELTGDGSLIYSLRQITNKDLLYSTESPATQYSVITYIRKESKEE